MIRARLATGVSVAAFASLLLSGTPGGALAQTQPPPAVTPPAAGQPPVAGQKGALGGINFDIDTLARSPLGSWSEYTMARTGTDKSVNIRYALVDKTPQKLGLEIDTTTPQGDILMRFDFAAQGDSWKLAGGKMQRGDQKMEMPHDQIDATPPLKKGTPPGELVGTETVTIPAGTFACRHYRSRVDDDPKGPVMDMWLSDKVSPTGLVKSSLSPLGIGMTLGLTGSGAQAKTK